MIDRQTIKRACLAGLAGILLSCGNPPGGPALPKGTAVFLLTIDTLREDHMSLSGYDRETTPFLDSFASSGVYFSNCYAQSSWTLPSMLSLISSLPPPVFGIKNGVAPIPRFDDKEASSHTTAIEYFAESHVTLAEALQGEGYRTVGVSTNGHLIERQGFTQGFDFFDEENCMWGTAEEAFAVAWNAIEEPSDKPLFLWVHLFDPHFDSTGTPPLYYPQSGYQERFGEQIPGDVVLNTIADYDRKIRYADDQIRLFFGKLYHAGYLEEMLVVVAADHGEEFFEKKLWGHAKSLANTLVHVPLIFRVPGETAGRTVDGVVSNMDVMPTILDLLGISPPETVEGESLLGALRGELFEGHAVYTETQRGKKNLRALIDPVTNRKLVLDLKKDRHQFYDLLSDRSELNNLSRREQAKTDRMVKRLRKMTEEMEKRAIVEVAPGTMTEEERKRLEGLGYMGG